MQIDPAAEEMESEGFLNELKRQRWDDHRYYHHSRVNQSLHLLSAVSFLTAYVLLFVEPNTAPIIGWLLAMWSRQIGHFFFEPKGYDEVNHATHEHKEEIKVGYNLRRKIVLLSIWGLSPFVLYFEPSFFGIFEAHGDWDSFVRNLSIIWLALGAAGLLFRTVHLFFIYSIQTGLVWCAKILTDPFHDLKLYLKSPLHLLKGELIDPGDPGTGTGAGHRCLSPLPPVPVPVSGACPRALPRRCVARWRDS